MRIKPLQQLELWSHLTSRQRSKFVVITLLSVIVSVGEMLSIGAVIPLLTILISPKSLAQDTNISNLLATASLEQENIAFLAAVVFLLLVFFNAYMRISQLRLQAKVSVEISSELSVVAFRGIISKPYNLYSHLNAAELTSTLQKINTLAQVFILPTLTLVSSCLMLIGILIVLLILDIKLALVSVVTVGGMYYVTQTLTRERISKNGASIAVKQGEMLGVINGAINGIKEILLAGGQRFYENAYRSAITPYLRSLADNQLLSQSPRFVIEAVLILMLVCFALYSASFIPGGMMEVLPTIGAFALAAQRLIPILQSIYGSLTILRSYKRSVSIALRSIDEAKIFNDDGKSAKSVRFEHSITLQNVGFRYTCDSPQLFSGVNLTIKRGERVGIVGGSGSGKSTLLDIIMGLLKPTEGRILVDQVPLELNNLKDWRAKIAHVSQSFFITDASVLENISVCQALSEIDETKARQAAKLACISSKIESLPHQYHTQVGERGALLSGGERQRLSITRVFYSQNPILVLDEATSALDSYTEAQVIEALRGLPGDVTVIITSHRASILEICDKIIDVSFYNHSI